MTKVWEMDLDSHTQKLVLLALADNASDEGFCWPSLYTIAKKCCLTETGVRNQIRGFEIAGLITVEIGGGRLSNRYQFNLEKLEKWTNPPLNAVDPSPQCPCPHPSMPLTPAPHVVGRNHNRTAKEPLKNPSAVAAAVEKSSQPKATAAYTQFIDEWFQAHEDFFGRPYIFSGGRDGKRLKELLAHGMPVADLITLAKKAWQLGDKFLRLRAVTIYGFCECYSQIVAVAGDNPEDRQMREVRQRIQITRELTAAEEAGDEENVRRLQNELHRLR